MDKQLVKSVNQKVISIVEIISKIDCFVYSEKYDFLKKLRNILWNESLLREKRSDIKRSKSLKSKDNSFFTQIFGWNIA